MGELVSVNIMRTMYKMILNICLSISLVIGAPVDETSSVASDVPNVSDSPPAAPDAAEEISSAAPASESSSPAETVELSSVSAPASDVAAAAVEVSSSAPAASEASPAVTEAAQPAAAPSEAAPAVESAAVVGEVEGGDAVKPGDPVAVEEVQDVLQSAGVQGDIRSLVEDREEILLPVGKLPVAEEVKEVPDSDRDTEDGTVMSLPVAERVVEANNVEKKTESGGDGKMQVQLNLKALEGDPRDTAVGAAAVGVMADAVKAKGPEETQVHALTGFGQEIMELIDELEKDQ